MAQLLTTYPDGDIKSDVVLNAIEILTASEQQIFNMLGKTRAISTVHSYNTDTLDILGVYKFSLIDLDAEKPTRANPIWDAERLSERTQKCEATV